MGQRYEALHGGGWVAKTSKKSVTYFMDGPQWQTADLPVACLSQQILAVLKWLPVPCDDPSLPTTAKKYKFKNR